MSTEGEVRKILIAFGKKLGDDLNESLFNALQQGGRTNASAPALAFTSIDSVDENGASVKILATGKYWDVIDKGRGASKKKGNGAVKEGVGKDWQAGNNIKAQQIIYDLQVKYNDSKGIKTPVKKLSFEKATKQLSFLIARKIHKEGYKARPYLDRVINDGRIAQLTKDLAMVMSKDITIELTGIK